MRKRFEIQLELGAKSIPDVKIPDIIGAVRLKMLKIGFFQGISKNF